MFKGKYSKILSMILVILIVAILALAGYFGYDMLSAQAINKSADAAVEEFENTQKTRRKEFAKTDKEETNTENTTPTEIIDPFTEQEQEQEETSTEQSGGEKTTASKVNRQKTYMEGYEVLGTINIPKTKCKYPILSQVTKKSLETAVAVLYPTDAELNVDNVVIVGHNYRNGLFFSNNHKLSKGDKIEITSPDEKVVYVIYDMYYTTPDDASYMQRDTGDAREISLSTCNDDSSQRLIILAREQGK